MAAITNVTLVDTFDQQRIKINQLISYAYEIEDKANLIFITTNASFDTVNAAFTQSNTDNVRLTGAYITVNSGYVVANAAYNHSNLTYNVANIIFDNVNAVYQLTNLSFDTANAAFNQSNAEMIRLTSAFQKANNHEGRLDLLSGQSDLVLDWNESSFNRVNAAYEQSNTDNIRLTSAYTTVNAGYVVANSAYDYANTMPGLIGLVHNKLNVNFTTTNAAFTQSNTDNVRLTAAYNSVNISFTTTNSAYNLTNASFDVANAAFLKANVTNDLTVTLAATTGLGANTYSSGVGVSANAFSVTIGASSNGWANLIAISANNYAGAMSNSSNNWANTKVRTVSGISGQITSSGGIDPNIGLSTFGTSGTYNNITGITVDAFGRVSSVSASGNFSIPILYDSNNTGYYLDPNSGSRLNTVDADYLYSRGDIRSAGWLYAVGRVVVGEGQTSSLIEMRDTDNSTRFVHNNDGFIGFLNNAAQWRFRVPDDGNVIMGIYQDYLSNQIRSAIYYDHNDTSYYVDPNSISRLNDVRPNSIKLPNNTAYYLFGAFNDPSIRTGWVYADAIRSFDRVDGTIFYDYNNTARYCDPGSISLLEDCRADLFRDLYDPTNYYIQARAVSFFNDIRPNIIYDRNDTGWYVNPNETSRLVFLQLGANRWHTSEEGWARLYFAYGDSSIYRGGTTAQWVHGFRTQDDVTRWLMANSGDFFATGNITAYWSDRRLKKNITKITDWREIINGLNGYRFEWNDIGNKIMDRSEKGVQVGLIAQEVEEVLPQAAAVQMLQYKDNKNGVLIPKDDINYDPEKPYLTVREEKLIPVLVEAIKGLMAEVDELRTKLGN